MITKEQAETLTHGDSLFFTLIYKQRVLAEGNKTRHVRVSGKLKTWKTRPNDWKLPVKYGMYESAYIGTVSGCEDPSRFYLTLDEAGQSLPPVLKGRIGTKKQRADLEKLLKT